MTLQLPSHVQTNLNKEERLLQRNLSDLDKETKHRMRCIIQDQQVAAAKLRILQTRLLASQRKFHALIYDRPEGRNSSADFFDCDEDGYYIAVPDPDLPETHANQEKKEIETVQDKKRLDADQGRRRESRVRGVAASQEEEGEDEDKMSVRRSSFRKLSVSSAEPKAVSFTEDKK